MLARMARTRRGESGNGVAFRDRIPTPVEFERLRLALSGFRDGSGQNTNRSGDVYPGWRDFERVIADILHGIAPENKGVFDVVVPVKSAKPFGVSCKTSALRSSSDRVLMELSNSHAKFSAYLDKLNIDPRNSPALADRSVIELVESWHAEEEDRVDIAKSCYLVLTHDPAYANWRLFWFPLELQSPQNLIWKFSGKRIFARLPRARRPIWEWYAWSGGQLKYHPHISWAIWDSGWFVLEQPKVESPSDKASRYWPGMWPAESS